MFIYGVHTQKKKTFVFTRQSAFTSFLVRFDHRLTVIIYVAHVLHSLYTCPRLVLSISLFLMLRLREHAIGVGMWIRRYCVMNHS